MTNREFRQKTGNCGGVLNGNSGIEKYSNRWFHSRLIIAETSISELEGRAEENIHTEAQRQKDEEENRRDKWNTIKSLKYLESQERRKNRSEAIFK